MKALLVSDDESAAGLGLRIKLRELGFQETVECRASESAVTLALDTLPDVVILDITPERGGLSAAREIRQKLNIPIVLLTSDCSLETVVRARRFGITMILAKPFRGQDLLPAIEMAFAHAEEMELLKENVTDLKICTASRKIIAKAKSLLSCSKGVSEHDAFRRIRDLAMAKQTSMRQIAEAILLTEGR